MRESCDVCALLCIVIAGGALREGERARAGEKERERARGRESERERERKSVC